MSKELTPRTQAIRLNLQELLSYSSKFGESFDKIIMVLETMKDSKTLISAFTQLRDSVFHVAEHIESFSMTATGEPDEIMRTYYIDKHIRSHLDKAQDLIYDLKLFFSTSVLSEWTKLALILHELENFKKFSYLREDLYLTIKSHYADRDGAITQHIEQSKKGKKKRNNLESQIWYIDLHSKA